MLFALTLPETLTLTFWSGFVPGPFSTYPGVHAIFDMPAGAGYKNGRQETEDEGQESDDEETEDEERGSADGGESTEEAGNEEDGKRHVDNEGTGQK